MFETSMPDSDNRILFGQNIIQIVHHINSSCLVILTCHTITQREYDSMKERLMVKHGYRVLLECGGDRWYQTIRSHHNTPRVGSFVTICYPRTRDIKYMLRVISIHWEKFEHVYTCVHEQTANTRVPDGR